MKTDVPREGNGEKTAFFHRLKNEFEKIHAFAHCMTGFESKILELNDLTTLLSNGWMDN
jgi:hypothetical protein